MPIVKEEYDWTVGASAVTKDIKLAKRSIAAIDLQFTMLGAGAAATAGNALTQLGTLIYVKDGGKKITPEWSYAEWVEYFQLFFGMIPAFQDGTAADNKLAMQHLVIPFGRPTPYRHQSIFPTVIDPHVGFKPVNQPYLHMSMPADANSIDNRQVKVTVFYHDIAPRYNKTWTDWSSQTVSTSSLTDWTIGDRGLWLEAMLFATSAYNDTLTSDAPSIKDIEIERLGKDVLFSGAVPNIFGALLDTTVSIDDDYTYFTLSHAPFDNFANCVRLNGETKFRILGGVADAVKAAFSVLT